jgi:hypothetical protein
VQFNKLLILWKEEFIRLLSAIVIWSESHTSLSSNSCITVSAGCCCNYNTTYSKSFSTKFFCWLKNDISRKSWSNYQQSSTKKANNSSKLLRKLSPLFTNPFHAEENSNKTYKLCPMRSLLYSKSFDLIPPKFSNSFKISRSKPQHTIWKLSRHPSYHCILLFYWWIKKWFPASHTHIHWLNINFF